jgi:hypothetical protein
MPTNMDRAALVARAVGIESVSLRSAVVESDFDPLETPVDLTLTQQFRAKCEIRPERPDHLYVLVDLVFQAGDGDPGQQNPVLVLRAEYMLIYSAEAAAQYPEDARHHFAELNGMYNAWPYWRELVQTVTGRVGLAGVVVPVFRPRIKEVEDRGQLEIEDSIGGKNE